MKYLLLKGAPLLHGSKVQVSVRLLLLLGVEEPTAARPLRKRPEPLLLLLLLRGRRRGKRRSPHVIAKVAAEAIGVVAAEIARRAARAAAARVGVLLLQRPLLDVVGELGGGHAVRLLAVRLELRGSELGLQRELE